MSRLDWSTGESCAPLAPVLSVAVRILQLDIEPRVPLCAGESGIEAPAARIDQ